ncbi:unnamed protein product [Trichobilharzia regenti]|nr:unnamed protein product [Trichobilharzia regenti]
MVASNGIFMGDMNIRETVGHKELASRNSGWEKKQPEADRSTNMQEKVKMNPGYVEEAGKRRQAPGHFLNGTPMVSNEYLVKG